MAEGLQWLGVCVARSKKEFYDCSSADALIPGKHSHSGYQYGHGRLGLCCGADLWWRVGSTREINQPRYCSTSGRIRCPLPAGEGCCAGQSDVSRVHLHVAEES